VRQAFELGRRRTRAVSARGIYVSQRSPPFYPSPAEASELVALAARIGRLAPSHRDPERFHEEKDSIRRELLALSRRR
jgi:hypothetical protein